ncbi:MAG TPA: class II aldolase/adducin family protein [Rectinemataceae bacterium]|nr:class II aldolase/adducin family protein [Rectinemataceae bacterium]
MLTIREMKEKVLENTLMAYEEGLFAGTSGNLSVCDAAKEILAITPTSFRYEKMTLDDIVLIRMEDGSLLEGRHKPSSEWKMHTAILKSRPEIFGVVHTHSPYATSFAVTCMPIPLILIEMLGYIGGDIPVAEFALPGSVELGQRVVESLARRNACLMRNHGAVAVGATLDQAHLRAIYVEDAAKIYAIALGTGQVQLIPAEAVKAMKTKHNLPD